MDDKAFWVWPFRRLIWLLPAAFSVHILEEYVGGLPTWVTHVLGGSFNNLAFGVNNAIFMALMLALTLWTARSSSRLAVFLLIAWASGNILGRAVSRGDDGRA